jgi:S1-C subfamily serine protease
VGINVLILSHSGGSEGIGFAIPVDLVRTVAASIRSTGHVARSWLGVSLRTTSVGEGAQVVAVDRDGPADRAGVAVGDLIVRVADRRVRHPQDAMNITIGTEPGTHVPIAIVRNGKQANLDVQLGPVPAQQAGP